MIRNIKFIWTLFKLRLSKSMVYRLSFFGGTLVDGTLFLLWILMFNSIYGQVNSIGGWSQGQTIVFLGTFSLLNAISMTLFFFGVIELPDKIYTGNLDLYITKPINPLFRITFENINLGSAPLLLLSIGIISYGVSMLNLTLSIGTILLYIFFIILMAVLYYDMELIIRTVPFFVIKADSIEYLEGAMLGLCMRVPGVLFKGIFKLLFYFLVPYGIMATVPAEIISNSISVQNILISGFTVVVFTIIAIIFFRIGLKHYKSASS